MITTKPQPEDRATHLNQVLRVIRNVNQAIIKIKDRPQFLYDTCTILTQSGGYSHAWIILPDETEAAIDAVVEAGLSKNFRVMLNRLPQTQLLSWLNKAVSNAEICVFDNLLAIGDGWTGAKQDEDDSAQAIMLGRLEHLGHIYGFMGVSISAEFAADEQERKLFKETADDVAMILWHIDKQKKREQIEEWLEQYVAQLTQLNYIGMRIGSELEPERVFEEATALVHSRFGYFQVDLFVLEADRKGLHLVAGAGKISSTQQADRRVKLGQGVVGWVASRNQKLLVNDLATCPELKEDWPNDGLLVGSELAVPVQMGEACIGVLDLKSPYKNAFNNNDLALMDILATQIGVAIKNAQLYRAVRQELAVRRRVEEEIRRRNSELTLLNQVIAISSTEWEIERKLEAVCRELAQALNLPQVLAILLNKEKTYGEMAATYLAEGRSVLLTRSIAVEHNPLFYHLLVRKTPLVIDNARTDARLTALRQKLIEQQIGALLFVPLVIDDQVIGGFEIVSDEPRHFLSYEINMAWGAAEQIAGSIARARMDEDRRLLEEQYRQAQKMEAIGRLTGGIAHDFNNLLTGINGFAELIQSRLPADSPLQSMAGSILRAGRRAADLVQQLMAFSRKQVTHPKILNLNQTILEMDKMLRMTISEEIEFNLILTPDLWPVKIDPTQISQVIINLVVNARDAMGEGGVLTIKTAKVDLTEPYWELLPGNFVMLSVTDTGSGMSEEVKAHIFEPFFTTKELGRGTGLGLATVYGIVKQNNGAIDVETAPGQGTTFKIYLPGIVNTGQMASETAEAEDHIPIGQETILLVEDDIGVRGLTRQILEELGYAVLDAESGPKAILLTRRYTQPVHLLITDVIMPEMNGKILAEKLAVLRPGLKVLFMSGYADTVIASHGVLDRGVAFLKKPFSTAELAQKVRAVLDKKE